MGDAPKAVLFTDGGSESAARAREVLAGVGARCVEREIDGETDAFVRKLCGGPVSTLLYANGRWLPAPGEADILHAFGKAGAGDGRSVFDVVVIGLGPAGLAACHGCRLGGLEVLGLNELDPGGHLLRLTEVDNYLGLGFEAPLTGSQLAEAFAAHVRQAGAVLARGRVDGVRIQGALKRVHSDVGTFWARAVVVATGAARQQLSAEGAGRFLERGIRDAASLNPAHYEGARTAVIGGGDEAFHAAIALAPQAKFVTVLCPVEVPSSDAALVDRAKAAGARVISGAKVVSAHGGDGLEFLSFMEQGIDEEQSLPVDAAVVALGPEPRPPIPGLERMPQEEGYYAHGEGGKTMFGGVYVAGDCTNMEIRTLMSVAASGSLCAKRLAQWLASHPQPRL